MRCIQNIYIYKWDLKDNNSGSFFSVTDRHAAISHKEVPVCGITKNIKLFYIKAVIINMLTKAI